MAASSSTSFMRQHMHNVTVHGNTGHFNSFNTQATFVFCSNDHEPLARDSQVFDADSQLLPPAPHATFGRDVEKVKIISIFLETPTPRLVILGPGGIGKTTLSLSTLHSKQIAARFKYRYFFRCDGVITPPMLRSELADILGIPPPSRDGNLDKVILRRLNKPFSLICIDNFETPWLEASPRSQVTEFLAHLDSLENLAILVTMRGIERPDGVRWSIPLLPSLSPVDREATHHVLQDLIGDSWSMNDEHIQNLVQIVEGMPLAARLSGALLRDGLETPESLWNRWEKEKTRVLKIGSDDRLSSLDVSIHLSLNCRYMNECPEAHQLLRALASLPDGFSDSQAMKARLSQYLPSRFAFPRALHMLRKVALVYVDQQSRIRILPPIRHFCLSRFTLVPALDKALTTLYVNFINEAHSSPLAVTPEISNIHSRLEVAVPREKTGDVIRAAIAYTNWCRRLHLFVYEIISLAILHTTKSKLRGDCLHSLAWLQYRQGAVANAEASIIEAVSLHKRRSAFFRACRLRRRAHSTVREADDLLLLGRLQMYRDELARAEGSFTRAIELHQQAHSVLGGANDLQDLGELQMHGDELHKAEASFTRAIKLHQQAQDVLGEANDLHLLGRLQIYRDELAKAEASLTRAITLHQQAHSALGEANDLQDLGELQMRRDELDTAEASFTRAIMLHQQALDVLGEANDLQKIAQLQMRRDELDKAEASFIRAIVLHQQAQDVLGGATDLRCLGELYIKTRRLDQADSSLQRALELYEKSVNPWSGECASFPGKSPA